MRESGKKHGMQGGRFRRYFLTGLVIVLPIIVTVWILVTVFYKLTGMLLNVVRLYTPLSTMEMELGARVVSLVIIVCALTLIGMIARNVLGRRLLAIFDLVCVRIPLFGRMYAAIKQIIQAFIGEQATIFKKVVLVEYPRKGVYTVAFMTSDAKGETQQRTARDLVNVFLPTTPNPTSGFLLMVPREEIIPLSMKVEDGMKLVISGGSVVPSQRVNPKDQTADPNEICQDK